MASEDLDKPEVPETNCPGKDGQICCCPAGREADRAIRPQAARIATLQPNKCAVQEEKRCFAKAEVLSGFRVWTPQDRRPRAGYCGGRLNLREGRFLDLSSHDIEQFFKISVVWADIGRLAKYARPDVRRAARCVPKVLAEPHGVSGFQVPVQAVQKRDSHGSDMLIASRRAASFATIMVCNGINSLLKN